MKENRAAPLILVPGLLPGVGRCPVPFGTYTTMTKLNLSRPCLPFSGCLNDQGYGKQRYEGKVHRAHRVAYAKAHNLTMDELAGVVIRHECDNPSCVEPTHLLAGTQLDNTHDCLERGRGHSSAVKRKLTADAVREVRRLHSIGATQTAIAKRFDVTRRVIRLVLTGERYKEVP